MKCKPLGTDLEGCLTRNFICYVHLGWGYNIGVVSPGILSVFEAESRCTFSTFSWEELRTFNKGSNSLGLKRQWELKFNHKKGKFNQYAISEMENFPRTTI